MTLTFKDPNGVEWELIAHACAGFPGPLPRHAEPADLLAALGQLSTGSDGPTDEELEDIWLGALDTGGEGHDRASARRALYAAGAASRQAEVDRLTARLACVAADGGITTEAIERLFALESELAAAKEKLAEVERLRELRGEAIALAEDSLREACEEAAQLRSKLERARRSLSDIERAFGELPSITSLPDSGQLRIDVSRLQALKQALASAATDADQTEAPKCERCHGSGVDPAADSSGPPHCQRCAGTGKEPPRPEAGESGPARVVPVEKVEALWRSIREKSDRMFLDYEAIKDIPGRQLQSKAVEALQCTVRAEFIRAGFAAPSDQAEWERLVQEQSKKA